MSQTFSDRSTVARGRAASVSGEQFDLKRLFAMLLAGKWWIIGCVFLGVLLAIAYLLVTPYTYTADSLLRIQGGGQSPLKSLVGTPFDGLTQGEDAARSEMPIITSREVLGQAVKDLNLTINIVPNLTPIIGAAFYDPSDTVAVSRFDVPQRLVGRPFELKVHSARSYTLTGPEGNTLLSGEVGKTAKGEVTGEGPVSILVTSITASPGSSFEVTRKSWLSVVNNLKGRLSISELGSGSGILQLSMTGLNKLFVPKLLNTVAHNYVEQNIDAQSKDAQKSLEFLNSQLPKLKKKLDDAESRLAAYKEKNQPIDLPAESQALLQQVSNLEARKSQLKLEIAQLTQEYTPQYPEVKADQRQLAQISEQSSELQRKIDKLPSNQKDLLSYQRDVQVDTQLYTSLLNKAQELRVVKAGTIGNVRIVDPAVVPLTPTAPKAKLVVFALAFVGLLVGIGIVVLRAALRRGVDDPAELEQHTGYSVYAVVPFSDWMARQSRRRPGQGAGPKMPILARDQSEDVAVEALRSLRTSLHFAQMEAGSNVVLMTGPAPGVGKSFLSLNLGYLLARTDRRILIVDADMRRGHLHDALAPPTREKGLSELLSGTEDPSSVVRRIDGTNLDIVTSGTIPPNPAELLMRERFKSSVTQWMEEYDLVILDAPPILAVTDASIISASLEKVVTFIVLNAGVHPMQEVDETIARFTRQGGSVTGLILNRYRTEQANAAYGYGHYQYAYSSDTGR